MNLPKIQKETIIEFVKLLVSFSIAASEQKKRLTKRTTGLVATAHPKAQNHENCQKKPCWSKALTSQMLLKVGYYYSTSVTSIKYRRELFKLSALIDQGSQRSF